MRGAIVELAYRSTYEEQAEPVMERHDHHVKRLFQPGPASGFPFTPDIREVGLR